ncbi:MAG: ATP synthase F0 subunit B [Myxococcales bacterium]|nr:ATP synthase F0 subunit B [Myxococcales bacterium]
MFATISVAAWDLPTMSAGLVDVDATAIVQFGFFIALVLVLPKLVFEPLLSRFEQREARTDGARADARRMLKEADAQVAVYEKAMADEKQTALAERAAARNAAQKEANALIAKVRAETNSKIDAGIAALRGEADKARGAIEAEAGQIAALITAKIVGGQA